MTASAAQDTESTATVEISDAHLEATDLEPGVEFDVDATVMNTGDESETDTVRLKIDGQETDHESVTLDPNEGKSHMFNIEAPEEPGEYTLSIETTDDAVTEGIRVLEPPNSQILPAQILVEPGPEADIEVTSYSLDPDPAEEPLYVGDTLTVEAALTNHGTGAGEFEVEYIVDDEEVATETVEVDAATTELVELDHELRETGTKVVSVNGVDPAQILVEPGPEADIEVTSYTLDPDPAEEPLFVGDTLTVEALLTNHGTGAGEYEVEYIVDDEVVATETVEVDAETTELVELDHELRETGTKIVSVNGVDPAQIFIESEPDPEANFDVTISDTNSPLDPGEKAVVEATVVNAGDGTGTQTIDFTVADHAANESIQIAPGGTESVPFEWQTTSDDIGTHTATVASKDDQDTTAIDVTADHPSFVSAQVTDETPALVDITFDQEVFVDVDAPTAGFTVSVDGSIADLETASAVGTDVALELAEPLEDGDDIQFSYDGNSDNIVNEHDLEAHAFESGDVDNRVDPLAATVTTIDPTTQKPTDRVSIDVTVEEGIIISAEDSLVPAGQAVTYEWEIDGQTFTTTEPSLTEQFPEPGTYEGTLTLRVGERSSVAEFSPEVVDETPPDVRLTAAETVGVGEDPNLDASESSDNVAIAEFEWDFDDGTADDGADLTRPEHSFDEPGEYEVTVTATDTSGNSAQNSTTITVEEDEESDEETDLLPKIRLQLLVLATLVVGAYWYIRRRN